MNLLLPASIIAGRYRIVKQIGQGGFGAVYEAIDLRLNNRVALKQLLLAGDEINRAFRREAELLASLRHAALPKVFDFFTDDLGQFLVMEYIAGDDLSALLQQRDVPFPVNQTLDWADLLLGVLGYLHTRTPPILHRDIKPQNLKLTSSNEIVLLDFGLAKGSASGATGSSQLHSIHAYTPGYAPLEQMHGQGTTPPSDLYALAATVYYLLTRTVPPQSTTRASDLLRQYPDPLRPLHEVNAAVPATVSEVLMRALALHAEDRPASAAAMRAELRAARQGVAAPPPQPLHEIPVLPDHTVVDAPAPQSTPAPGRTRMMRWAALAGSLLVIVLLVALVWRPLTNREPDVVAGETTAPPTQTVVAAVAAASATPQASATAAPSTIEAPTTTVQPTATARTGIAVPTVTANPTTAAPAAVGRIAFTSNQNGSGEIFVMDADGSNLTRLTVNDLNVTDHSPTWSPDGARIAYVSSLAEWSNIFVMNADGTGQTQLTEDQTFKSEPTWSPDGRRIAFVSGSTGDTSIQVMNADGSNRYQLAQNQGADNLPAWSPDGTTIIYVSDSGNEQGIAAVNADGTDGRQLTFDNMTYDGLQWSPDGRKIMYVAGDLDTSAIYVMNADGNGQTRITEPEYRDDSPRWSPDGERIVFISRRNGSPQVFVMERNGGGQTAVGDTADAFSPRWSPDGGRIVFSSDHAEDANNDVYTMNADGSDVVRLTTDPGIADAPVWTPRN